MSAPWLLHGVVRAAAPRPPEAPPHARVRLGTVAVLLSPSRMSGATEDDAAEAVRHDALLSAYARRTDVAPLRFGAAASGPAAAVERLAPRAAALDAALERVRGAVEFSLRLVDDETPEPAAETEDAPASGRDWLRGRAAGRRAVRDLAARRERFAAGLAEAAAEVAREVAPRPSRRTDGPIRRLDLALLAPREAAAALAERCEALAPEAAALGLALRFAGPFAPYGFAAPEEVSR